jgi:hypothetical protein
MRICGVRQKIGPRREQQLPYVSGDMVYEITGSCTEEFGMQGRKERSFQVLGNGLRDSLHVSRTQVSPVLFSKIVSSFASNDPHFKYP